MSVIVFYKTPIFEAIRPIFTQTTKKRLPMSLRIDSPIYSCFSFSAKQFHSPYYSCNHYVLRHATPPYRDGIGQNVDKTNFLRYEHKVVLRQLAMTSINSD